MLGLSLRKATEPASVKRLQMKETDPDQRLTRRAKNGELEAPEAPATRYQRFVARGGIWVAAQGALQVAILVLGVAHRSSPLGTGMALAGGVCLVGGACFGIAGALALGSNLTPYPKPSSKARLVRHGIYARVRHPLYTSVTSLSAGWALIWQSWPAGAAVLALALFFDAKARREESWLRARFPAYENYAKTTRKFIPWIY